MANMSSYDPQAIEARWLRRWNEVDLYRVDLDRAARPFYNLMEFPYPSGEGLHVGHFYSYCGADTFARYQRMRGHDVFQPMGFDAFGIHGENYALQLGEPPAVVMARNVARFREEQIKRMGAAFDWSREVNTTDPRYYKWTQWIFVQLFKAGLAYRASALVNWCPKDLTVLADEQVIDGACERCGTPVVKRELEQWFFTITRYAERLLDHSLAEFTETTRTLQRNWIGRSSGAEIRFRLEGPAEGEALPVFTTRPDTLWGATFLVLAPEHPLVARLTAPERRAEVEAYAAEAARRSEIEREDATREKTGTFIGAYALNPVNAERIPIWIADYVLMRYGTGAIMAVPAHDERDFAFARRFDLPVRVVIRPPDGTLDGAALAAAWTGEGSMVDSGPLTGTPAGQTVAATIEWLSVQGVGAPAVRYRLRDWLISRQRYWGPPIPMIHCARDGWQPVPEEQLPVLLPETDNFRPTGTGASPLASIPEFVAVACPVCGGPARRETDVSDNFLDSAWYFLRYLSTEFDDRPWDAARARRWLPVAHYMGGVEHSTLHHLYARFIWKAMYDLGHIPREVGEEPFGQLRLHGWVLRDGAKMSKSRGNVVNPDGYVREHGADVMRTHVLFMGSYVEGGDWRDAAIVGVERFYRRVWDWIAQPPGDAPAEAPLEADERRARRALHKAIRQASADIPALGFNTAIASLMEALNVVRECRLAAETQRELARTYVLLLAPFAPFLAEELWERLGGPFSVHQQAWPEFDPALGADETLVIPVQVNGKLRARLEVAAGTPEDEIRRQALAAPAVQKYLAGRADPKVIYVPGRLVNIVVSEPRPAPAQPA
jgi:leucyl-tRNA synthetase